jgi:dolichol-phosphate mannosyltransferase
MDRTVSVIVPVYYNAESLPHLFAELQRVETQLAALGCALELIFVDDGSGDASFDELLAIRQQRPATRLIKLARNFGAIHASKIGLNYVTGDCFMWLAADLQDPPYLIVDMTRHWLKGAKFVLAARTTRGDPAVTKLFAALYYRLVRWLIVPDYPPTGFDIMLMDKQLLPYVRDSSKNMNTTLLLYWLGFKPVILEYIRPERPYGKSRWTFFKKFDYFVDSLVGFSVLPIRIISLIGFIIGEYIWRIFDEVTRRPEVVIDEVY